MDEKIKVNINPAVFNPVYRPFLDNDSRTQIYYGGSSSGKSWFLAQRCVIDLMRGGRNYLVCRAVARTIRTSVFAQIERVIREFGLLELFDLNKSDAIITCTNGYQVLFAGLDDVEKIKSITPKQGAITDIWVEEATETDKNDVKSLYKRQRGGDERTAKRLTLSFNPILQSHWIYDEFFSAVEWTNDQTTYISPDQSILKTTYKDNRFLTEQDKLDLESETDRYFREVYTLGHWGVLGHVIFTNWRTEDLSEMRDQFTNLRAGLDFGFSTNPAAIGISHYDKMRKTIYVYDEFYETGQTNDLLADQIKRMIGNERIICDSAEPKSIKELQNHGVNAVGARKGKDSITHGVQWLQQQTIIVDKSCVNMRNELQQYKWKEGADGRPVSPPKPVDANNHLIDGGLRYAYEDDMLDNTVGTEPNPFYD